MANVIGLGWMAWTWQTALFFLFIFGSLVAMGVWEYARPGGAPRHGILGLDTTRGDRLFISLITAAYVHVLWLAFLPAQPLYLATAIAILLAIVIFSFV